MYHFNEGHIDLPDQWKDQSINIISSTGGSEPGLSFTITRDDIPWGMEFTEYVSGEIEKASESLTEFKILAQQALTVSEREAVEIECTWTAKQGPMHQVITTVNAPSHAMVLTASMPGKMSDAQKAQVKRIVETLSLTEPAA
ncbi:DcrB-related protein [Aestuariibius insulae]|uniref:DcrB-related protein n=1 Tax=Aestuariibius insulae TaxID=2058287 RepID=UPI00345EC67F